MTTADNAARTIDYGLSTTLFKHLPMEQALERIAAAGFHWVEASALGVHLDPRAHPDLEAIGQACDELDIQVRSVHLPFIPVERGVNNPAFLPQQLELLGKCLEGAAGLGATVAVLHSSSMMKPGNPDVMAACKELSLRLVPELSQRAADLGVRIAVENELVGYAAEWALSMEGLTSTFPAPEIGFCLDTGHAVAYGLDCLRELQVAGDRLLAVHINSNDGVRDIHWVPDQGKLDWPPVKAAMLDHFHGLWTLEIKGTEAPEAVLEDVVRFVREDG
jgi:sugar phosphate isomerase/epimerase